MTSDYVAAQMDAALDHRASYLSHTYFIEPRNTFAPAALAADIQRVVPLRMAADDQMRTDGQLRWYDNGVFRGGGDAAAAYVAQQLLVRLATTARVNDALAHIKREQLVRPVSMNPDATNIVRARGTAS